MTIFKNTAMPPPLNKKRYYNSIGYKYCESGRSLVEMLGALTIMGILSMAGIWAYNAAMDKLKANTIINEAQKRAVVIAGQIGLMGSTHPTLGEFKENAFGGGTFSTNVTTEGLYQQFGIQVAGVPKTVCQNILNSIGEGSAIRRLSPVNNPQTSLKSCQDQNTFLIIYNNNASSTGGDVIYCDNSFCQTICGQCVSEDGQNKCINECPASANQCTQNSDCTGSCVGCVIPGGETQGTCQSCKPVAYLESTRRQWIDTEVASSSSLKLEIDALAKATMGGLIGAGLNATSADRIQIYAGQSGNYTARLDGIYTETDYHVGTQQLMVLDVKNKKFYVNGTEYNIPHSGSLTTRNIFLFAVNMAANFDGNLLHGKIFHCKI